MPLIPEDRHADLCIQGQSAEQDPGKPSLGNEEFGKRKSTETREGKNGSFKNV